MVLQPGAGLWLATLVWEALRNPGMLHFNGSTPSLSFKIGTSNKAFWAFQTTSPELQTHPHPLDAHLESLSELT